jgi:hypothetical protein
MGVGTGNRHRAGIQDARGLHGFSRTGRELALLALALALAQASFSLIRADLPLR